MLRVIVADDEYFARKALIKMLEEMELPIEICGDCENGQDVVELLKTCQTDLIITDIRMPGMDGLKLAEYVREHELDTEIMIETGYAEFEYARTAIRYGVKEYLTKPVNDRELRSGIENVIRERSERKKREIWELLDISYILQNSKLCREMFGWTGEQAKKYYCMVLVNGREKIKSKAWVEEWLGKYGKFRDVRGYFLKEEKSCIFLAPSEEIFELPKCFGKSTVADMAYGSGDKNWISFSGWHCGEKELEQAYRECVYSMNERILKPGQIFFYNAKENFQKIITGEQETRLSNAAQRGYSEEADIVIQEIFSEVEKEDVSIYSFFMALMQIFFVLNRVLCLKEGERDQGISAGYLLFDFKMELYRFYELKDVRQYVDMLVKEVCQKNTEGEDRSMMEDLLDYLERNYAHDISLEELARRKYFVSSSYLSRMFKSYTGQTFMKYLISYRMDKAKSFLECSQMDISDIAACTGYNDPSHFTQTFRRVYGVTPKEYRKQYKENAGMFG